MIREYKEAVSSLLPIYDSCFPQGHKLLIDTIFNFRHVILVDGEAPYISGILVSILDQGEPWIWTVAVWPDFQERGIGTRLIKEIEKYYTGYKQISLFVNSNNPAQKLYFDLGYRVVDIVKDIYEDGDALKMVKELK